MTERIQVNPIIPGFAPDPSLVLVDGTYYLVNSTFHLFPGLPIYTSQDLIHWKHIGNAINRPGQLSLAKSTTTINVFENGDHMYATGGLYAPTIRYHHGTFYVVCTNVIRHSTDGSSDELQNFIVSSKDIEGNQWSDPVLFDFYGIDPSLFFDFDGKAYICGSKSPGPKTRIMLFEIDVATGSKLTEEHELWNGTGGIYPEGPHIYFRNDFYYLMIAEGGTHEGHSVTMARSKNIRGPYEPSPENPILSAAGTDEYVQCTGHCEAFEDKNGDWWGVCLAIRMGEDKLYGLGRETFLARGCWTEDGWLKFDRARTQLSMPDVQVRAEERLVSSSDADLLYIHDPDLSLYNISKATNDANKSMAFSLTASPVDITAGELSPTFVGKRQRLLDGESSVTLIKVDGGSSKAGLAVYKDEHRFLRIYYSTVAHTVTFEMINRAKNIERSAEHRITGDFSSVQFIVRYTEREYRALFSVGDQNAIELGKVDAMEFSSKDFVGPIVGIFAIDDKGTGGTAQFDKLVIDGDSA